MSLAPAIAQEVAETIEDPCLFARAWLCEDPWEKQDEIMRAVEAHRRVVVAACHSSAKTRTAAYLTLWWLAKYQDGIVITTAPGKPNLQAGIWAEIPTLIRQSRYPFPEPLTMELRFNEKRRAYGYTTNVQNQNEGVRFQGAHSENMLIIVDEASGVEMPIFRAINGIMASGNCRLLLLLNPLVSSGYAYDACTRMRDLFHYIKISAFDTPNLRGLTLEQVLAMDEDQLNQNVRPYLHTRQGVIDAWKEYGNNFYFQSRVMGDFPDQGEDSLIKVAWAERARRQQEIRLSRDLPLTVGIDVAGEGEDETCVYVLQGDAIVDMLATPNEDSRGKVAAFLMPYKPYIILVNVDSIGVGYFYALHLRDLGFPVQMVNVALDPLPIEPDAKRRFLNLKSQMYMRLMAHFEQDLITNLADDRTRGQLTTIRYHHNEVGKIYIERKADARKRGVKSPDRAEALMLAKVPRVVQNRSAGFAMPEPAMISPV